MSAKLVFTAEDFGGPCNEGDTVKLSPGVYGIAGKYMLTQEGAAIYANKKFRAWLAEQTVVYSSNTTDWEVADRYTNNTHTARLVNIEPLAPKVCEHDVICKVATSASDPKPWTAFECRKCGAKLKATWSAE